MGRGAKDLCTENTIFEAENSREQPRLDRKSDLRDRRKVSRNGEAPHETSLVLNVPKEIQETFILKKNHRFLKIIVLKFCFSCCGLQMLR